MGEWHQVRWTEARQVAELMGVQEDDLPEPGMPPRAHYEAVRAAGDRAAAVNVLGHALPRLEAIAWAAHLLEAESRKRRLRPKDQRALDYALRWLGEPNDDRRRAAFEAAEAADDKAPERVLALAVFFSGGSMSQPDLPAVLPPPETAGKLAAAAITVAASRMEDPAAALDQALDLGEKVAEQGLRALSPA